MILKEIKNKWAGVLRVFARYWGTYGGVRELLLSPYFQVSMVVSLVCFPIWNDGSWIDVALSISPSLFGFTLAGYAMIFVFGHESFQKLLMKTSVNSVSVYFMLSGAFAHFMVIQFLAILAALSAKSWAVNAPRLLIECVVHLGLHPYWFFLFLQKVYWFLGFFIFVYSCFLGLASVMALFRMSFWFDQAMKKQLQTKQKR